MNFEDLKEYCVVDECNGDTCLIPFNNRVILCQKRFDCVRDEVMTITKSDNKLTVRFYNGSAIKVAVEYYGFDAYLHGKISQIKPKQYKGIGLVGFFKRAFNNLTK